jgi:hypothetical protein
MLSTFLEYCTFKRRRKKLQKIFHGRVLAGPLATIWGWAVRSRTRIQAGRTGWGTHQHVSPQRAAQTRCVRFPAGRPCVCHRACRGARAARAVTQRYVFQYGHQAILGVLGEPSRHDVTHARTGVRGAHRFLERGASSRDALGDQLLILLCGPGGRSRRMGTAAKKENKGKKKRS